ncbi:helix-turn-helix domain-containing protein [Marinomonas sp. 2405UD68-3]
MIKSKFGTVYYIIDQGISPTEVAKNLGIGRSTIYKLLKESN